MFGLMRTKTHMTKMVNLQNEWLNEAEKIKADWQQRVDIEFNLALFELSKKLREMFVDLNYELFTTSTNLLKARINGFIVQALYEFHDKQVRKITKPEEKEDFVKPEVETALSRAERLFGKNAKPFIEEEENGSTTINGANGTGNSEGTNVY